MDTGSELERIVNYLGGEGVGDKQDRITLIRQTRRVS